MRSLEAAARSRSEADWLVGMNATRAATVEAAHRWSHGVVSLGRVQTPTLAILVARETRDPAFVPMPYWLVDATFQPESARRRTAVAGSCAGPRSTCRRGEHADAIVERVADGEGHVTVAVASAPSAAAAAAVRPDGAAARGGLAWYGFTARRTLSAAQGCYEKAGAHVPAHVEQVPARAT